MGVVCFVQAREGSTRLPFKALERIGGVPSIRLVFERLKQVNRVDSLYLLTGPLADNGGICSIAEFFCDDIICYDDEDDVFGRFAYARELLCADDDHIVRVTGDCPFLDPQIIDNLISAFLASGSDYGRLSEKYPEGLDGEIFSVAAFDKARLGPVDTVMKEHVTQCFVRSDQEFKKFILPCTRDLSDIRVTLDEYVDLEVLRQINSILSKDFGLADLVRLFDEDRNIFKGNSHVARNEGLTKSLERARQGQKPISVSRQVCPVHFLTHESREKDSD